MKWDSDSLSTWCETKTKPLLNTICLWCKVKLLISIKIVEYLKEQETKSENQRKRILICRRAQKQESQRVRKEMKATNKLYRERLAILDIATVIPNKIMVQPVQADNLRAWLCVNLQDRTIMVYRLKNSHMECHHLVRDQDKEVANKEIKVLDKSSITQ